MEKLRTCKLSDTGTCEYSSKVCFQYSFSHTKTQFCQKKMMFVKDLEQCPKKPVEPMSKQSRTRKHRRQSNAKLKAGGKSVRRVIRVTKMKSENDKFDCEKCGKTVFIIRDNYRGCQHYQVAELMVRHYRALNEYQRG